MKILFLDFDGVLNSEAFFKTQGGYIPESLDRAAVARVNDIVDRTGADIVISSTWRIGYSVEQLRSILTRHGFTGRVIGVTPELYDVDADGIRTARAAPRGHHIQAWLDAQPEAPEAFVILDDVADMAHLAHRLVQTEFDVGLGDEHVEAAVVLLGARPA